MDNLGENVDNSRNHKAMKAFREAEVLNYGGDTLVSLLKHYKAFDLAPDLMSFLVSPEHVQHGYVHRTIPEHAVACCPLCGGVGKPRWAFNMATNKFFRHDFNPIRLWMHCESCSHVYASAVPQQFDSILVGNISNEYKKLDTAVLPTIGLVMHDVLKFCPVKLSRAMNFLDVGVGAGESYVVAQEFGLNVSGVEVNSFYVDCAVGAFGGDIACSTFADYEAESVFDVIWMGDVLEHMVDPVAAIRKAHSLLSDKGLLWISTPNFESAMSLVKGVDDPMKRVCEHLNYFSFKSLEKVLGENGFYIMDYKISLRFAGSMEVTCMKR